jgi:hypothetical protein
MRNSSLANRLLLSKSFDDTHSHVRCVVIQFNDTPEVYLVLWRFPNKEALLSKGLGQVDLSHMLCSQH